MGLERGICDRAHDRFELLVPHERSFDPKHVARREDGDVHSFHSFRVRTSYSHAHAEGNGTNVFH